MLFSDDDAGVVAVADMLKQWSANNWPILLDSPEFAGALAYLEAKGKLTPERIATLKLDASRDETQTPNE